VTFYLLHSTLLFVVLFDGPHNSIETVLSQPRQGQKKLQPRVAYLLNISRHSAVCTARISCRAQTAILLKASSPSTALIGFLVFPSVLQPLYMIATQPSKERSIWPCPFKKSGRCRHSKSHFSSSRGVAQHVRVVHAHEGIVTPYSVDPEMFVSHNDANGHRKNWQCSLPPKSTFSCPWQPHMGCDRDNPTAKTLANHARSPKRQP